MISRRLIRCLSTESTASSSTANEVIRKEVVGYAIHGQFTRRNTVLTLSQKYIPRGKKHNTEDDALIAQVRPLQEPKIVLSTGQLGFKNTKQGGYDAAYQTASRMFELIQERGYLQGRNLEIVFRGFGAGREAFTNALLGKEGSSIAPKVERVTDATRIRFGGTKPPKPRRV